MVLPGSVVGSAVWDVVDYCVSGWTLISVVSGLARLTELCIKELVPKSRNEGIMFNSGFGEPDFYPTCNLAIRVLSRWMVPFRNTPPSLRRF